MSEPEEQLREAVGWALTRAKPAGDGSFWVPWEVAAVAVDAVLAAGWLPPEGSHRECPDCFGTGRDVPAPGYDPSMYEVCRKCGGRGWLEATR